MEQLLPLLLLKTRSEGEEEGDTADRDAEGETANAEEVGEDLFKRRRKTVKTNFSRHALEFFF